MDGPIQKKKDNPHWEEENNLVILNFTKFALLLFILIMITASYLNAVTANNPWSMTSMFTDPTVCLVLLGNTLMDTLFTISSLLGFYNVNKIYEKNNNHLSLADIIKLYLKRYFRYAPVVFIVFFMGIYVMPFVHGNPDDKSNDPIWYSFQEVLFYRCEEP